MNKALCKIHCFLNLKDVFLIMFIDVVNGLGFKTYNLEVSTAANGVGGTTVVMQHLAFIYFIYSGAKNKAFAELSQRDRKQ